MTVEQQLSTIQETQREHSVALRSIADGITQLLDILTPKVTDGPTLDEILAQLVTQIGDQGVILRRIEGEHDRDQGDPSIPVAPITRGQETGRDAGAGDGMPEA